MEKKLYGFLKHLEQEKKSKSSIKNYKADITQFLRWKSEVSPETSLSAAFKTYLDFLESKYSRSSIMRKVSSIKSFIKYAYPFENKNIEKRTKDNPLLWITGLSLSLSIILILLIVTPFLYPGESLSHINIKGVRIAEQNDDRAFSNKKGIVLSVSAPTIESEENVNQELAIPCNYD